MAEYMENPVNKRFTEAFNYLNASTNGLAKQMNVSQRTIWNYVNGVSIPSEQMVRKFCQFYPVFSYDYLMNGIGEMLRTKEEIENDKQSSMKDDSVTNYRAVQPLEESAPIASKMESIYQKLIAALEGQIEALKEKCASQEEQINLLRDLMEERK